MKVVINKCYGGFSLSKEGCERYWEIKNQKVWIEDDTKFKSMGLFTVWLVPPDQRLEDKENEFYSMSMEDRIAYNQQYRTQTWSGCDVDRSDPILVQLVEENSAKYSGRCAELGVTEIPDGVDYIIEEYDGKEWVAEKHRTWY